MKPPILRHRHGLLLTIACALAVLPAHAGVFDPLERMFKDWGLFQGLQITGTNDFTFQQNMVQGSASAYEGQRWDTDPFIRRSSLSLEGPIWKDFSFKADFSSSGYGPTYNRWILGYVTGSTALYYGDLNIDLSGNQFASFSKPVKGWQLDQKIGKGLARVFYSKEKAITRFQTIPGNNTSGPFFLSYTPVMQGTEVVKVNERVMEFGTDYRLDYDTGQLWFEVEGRPPTIIPDTSTITVSYQSAGFQSSQGTLSGARVLMPFMDDRLQIGLTYLKQDRGGGGSARDTVGYQEDIFNGSGSTGPFDVNFRPIIANGSNVVYQGQQQIIQQALVVLVDNVEKAEGVDYDSYRQIGRIIFRGSVPPTSLVEIHYYYDLSSSLPATNNNVMGLDLLYHFSPKLSLQAEWGRSNGGLTTNSGDALRMNLNYTGEKFKVITEYRDIAPTFTFLDSVGFYRQDKGLDIGVNWQPHEHVAVSVRRSDLKTSQGYSFGYSPYGGYGGNYGGGDYYSQSASRGVTTQQTDGEDVPSLDIKSQRTDVEVRLDFPNLPTLAFQREQLNNVGGTTGDSRYSSNNVTFNWSPSGKPYSLSGNFYKTNQAYVGVDADESRGSDTTQLQWSASYRPSEKLAISFNQGRNSSVAVGQTDRSTSGTDQLSVHWSPSSKIDVNYDLTRTDSLGSVSSGFYGGTYGGGGYGGGIGGGYYPPGDDDSDEPTENRYADNSQRLSVRFSPTQKLSFDMSMMKRKYTSGGTVGYLADSNQSTTSLNANYMFSESLSFNVAWTKDQMAFLEEGRGNVANNTMSFGANWRQPNSPWGFNLNYSKIDGSSPTYTGFGSNQHMHIVQNNMSDITGRITYALSEDSELGITGQLSDYAGGYANFNRQQLEVGYSRKLNSFANLTFGYRFSRNITKGLDDPRYGNTSLVPQNQNYLANTFMVTIGTQFSSGIGGGNNNNGFSNFGGSSSMSGFGGYRPGTSNWNMGGSYGSNYGNSYGNGYGGGFNNLSVFGNNPMGSGYSSPFGNTGSNYGSFGNQGSYGNYRPQGYEMFGNGFGGQGGFNSGLGDISGRQQNGGIDQLNMGRPGMPGQPGMQDGQGLEIEDWQALDDLYSTWW